MARQKLTARLLEKLAPGDLVRDALVRGMFAEASTTGAVSIKIQADLRLGSRNGVARTAKSVRMTLGRFPELTLDAARAQAMGLLAEIKAGRDPRGVAPGVATGAWTVGRLRDEYTKDLAIREKAKRTLVDLEYLFSQYLADWLDTEAEAITGDMARARHAKITVENGKQVANKAMKALRTVYSFGIKKLRKLRENPADAVTYHPTRPRTDRPDFVLPPVAGWLAKVRQLSNPLRANMHELGLFSGLRPGTLVALERAWLRLDERAIVIPAARMKSRREFALPLSEHMIGLVRRALAAGDVLHPGSPYLFPARSTSGAVIATAVWKERALPAETGHIVRHMFSNQANVAGVSSVNRMLLMAQKVPGIEGVYLQERALFETLRGEQERITAHILAVR